MSSSVFLMYGKLFASLYQGTLRGRTHEILVFSNLLAFADEDGNVDKHFRAIADETGLTENEVRMAIANLEAPDPESRSQEFGGARLMRLDDERSWGWFIVNKGKYDKIISARMQREVWAKNKAEQRARNKSKCPRHVQDKSETCLKMSSSVDVDVDVDEAKTSMGTPSGGVQGGLIAPESVSEKCKKRKTSLTDSEREAFDTFWKAYPRKVGKGAAERSWMALGCSEQVEGIVETIRAFNASEWQGREIRYIPHPATWLNRRGWEDEAPTMAQLTGMSERDAETVDRFVEEVVNER